MVKKIFIILFICLIAAAAFPQQVKVKAFTDSANYLIGDRITYHLQVTSPENISILTTGVKDSLPKVDYISAENPVTETKDGSKITTFNFVLMVFDSTAVEIPPIPVYYKAGENIVPGKAPLITPEQAAKDPSVQSVMSNPVSFMVSSLKVQQQAEIKDVKDPVKLPLDWKIVALWILGGLIIIAVLFYLYRKYWKKKEGHEVKIVYVPPHITALNALKNLEEKKLWQNGKVKEYHSEITEIIRRYFEDRFKFPALEMTTSEALFRLRNTPGTEKIVDKTYSFLTNADLVKFAKYSPMNTVNEEMMAQAFEIVNTTVADNIKQTDIVQSGETANV